MLRSTRRLLLKKMRALNVAEKPSVCKTVVEILSKSNYQSVSSFSKYHPIYEFDYSLNDSEYSMYFTSVRGHLMSWEFPPDKKKWDIKTIFQLYNTELLRTVNPDCIEISKNLENLSVDIDLLILWLDCDREGENIAFEVVDVVKNVNSKVKIKRAKFSSLTQTEINNAIQSLVKPNKNLAEGVDIRQNIDLIIGASLTRFQTLTLKSLFYPNISSFQPKYILSYGPCQFPTLGFIVDRTERIRKFKSENFHYIDMKLKKHSNNQEYEVKFIWKRFRLFDEEFVRTVYEKILDEKIGIIKQITTKPTYRSRPLPLNTVEFQKLSSRKLKMPSHEAMDIAEKLYNKGFISYPRTETQRYGASENLKKYVSFQSANPFWGEYANKLINEKRFTYPKKGSLDDKSHPPIHPVKYPPMNTLTEKEVKVYELIVRHFLATVSPDAKGEETIIEVEISEEDFTAKGLIITDLGFYEVFTYDKWEGSLLPNFNLHEKISPEIILASGKTSPPSYLSESDLISFMDKNGVGTDATIHEHIKTVQERGYAFLIGGFFKPSLIGTTLVKMYEHIGIDLYKPNLRANMEREIKEVCDGNKNKDTVLLDMKENMKLIFDKIYQRLNPMREFVTKYLSENMNYYKEINLNNYESKQFIENLNQSNKIYPNDDMNSIEINQEFKEKKPIEENTIIGLCPICNKGNIRVILSKNNKYFIGCSNFPNCKNTANFSSQPVKISKTETLCKKCENKRDKYSLFIIEYNNNSKETLCLGKCFTHNSPDKQKTSDTQSYSKKSFKYNYENTSNDKSYYKSNKNYTRSKVENSSNNKTSYTGYTKFYKKDPEKFEEIKEINETKEIKMESKKGKICKVCGKTGRHTKDSECLGLKKNQINENDENNENSSNKNVKKKDSKNDDDFII